MYLSNSDILCNCVIDSKFGALTEAQIHFHGLIAQT